MSNGNGHHWSKFSWRDWSADRALHPCSLAARGFWIEMLCIMHEGTPVGHLTLGGKPATIRQMAANAYCSEKEAAKCLAELEAAGVFSRTPEGTIYNRRMVKDAAASDAGREHAGKRWSGRYPNGPPNGGANGEASRGPYGQAYGHPNAKNQSKNKKEPPVGPHDVGTAPAEPGTPARRVNGSNPRALGTNPRALGINPRIKPPRNAFHDQARDFDDDTDLRAKTIDGHAENIEDFEAYLLRIKDGSNG